MGELKDFVDAIKEAQREAFKQNMLTNAVFLNPKYIKINSHHFVDNSGGVTAIPPMICGLEMYFVIDLPDNVSFAVTNIQKQKNDVVEVVRCKDCKYFGKDMGYGKHDCKKYEMPFCLENDFCSYGERKDDKNG